MIQVVTATFFTFPVAHLCVDFPLQTAARRSECLWAASRLPKQARAFTRSSSPSVRYRSNTSRRRAGGGGGRSKLSLIRPSALSGWREPASRLLSVLTRSRVLFLYVGYYVLVYLQGFFLHCVNSRQQEMLCHSLFLSGGQRRLFCCCRCANRIIAVCAIHSLHFSSPFRFQNMQISFQQHFPLDSERHRNEKSLFFFNLLFFFLLCSILFIYFKRKFVLKTCKRRNHYH